MLNRLGRAVDGARLHAPLLGMIATTSGARLYSALLSMAALTLTARWLGPDGRGVVVVVTTWVTLVATIGYLSLGQIIVHRAANQAGEEWIGPNLSGLLMVAAGATFLGWIGAGLLFQFGRGEVFGEIPGRALALGFLALPFLIWEQYGSALLSVIGRLNVYNLIQVVARTLGIVILFVAIYGMELGIYGFLISFVVTQALIASAGIGRLLKHVGGRLAGGLATISGLIRDGLKIHLNSIGVMLFSGVDILMLNHFRGATEAGIFQLPMQLFIALLLVPQSALLALNARVADRSRVEFWHEHRAIMGYIIGGMTLISIVLWLLAPIVITTLATEAFAASIPVFQILLVGLAGASFNTLMAIQWTIHGYFFRISAITLLAGAVNCLLNLFLIPKFGATGAAMATVIGLYVIPVVANATLAVIVSRHVRSDGGPR